MTVTNISISVIVCTYNRAKYIYRCLSLLGQNDYAGSWELLLVDNNSTDGTASESARFAADYPAAPYRYILETRQGLSHARNRGIDEAQGDWLVFLDDDAFVAPDYLSNLAQHLLTADFDAFGGRIVPLFENGEPVWYSQWARGFVSALDMGSEVVAFSGGKFPIGANMGISRRAIEQCGTFNPQLGRTEKKLLGGEEKDVFLRIMSAGMKVVYLPDIAVQHCIPASRTTPEFIARLGEGVGQSERLRTQSIGRAAYAKRCVLEGIKWCGTLLIALYYALRLQWQKGRILIHFRKHVTKGLMGHGALD